MTYYFPLLALSLVLFSSCQNNANFTVDCLSTNLKNGVIAFYPFNDGNLKDESTNNNDLINSTNATPSVDRNGNSNCAFMFDNSSQNQEYLSSPKSSFLDDLDEFSISLWYQPTDPNKNPNIQGIFSRDSVDRCPNKMGELSITLYDCHRVVFGHNNDVWADPVTGFTDGCQGEVDVLVNNWHHVVAIKKDDDYSMYFNGILQPASSGDADCGANTKPVENIGDLFVGYKFTGSIDDIIIYDRELSNAEVNELFKLDSCCL